MSGRDPGRTRGTQGRAREGVPRAPWGPPGFPLGPPGPPWVPLASKKGKRWNFMKVFLIDCCPRKQSTQEEPGRNQEEPGRGPWLLLIKESLMRPIHLSSPFSETDEKLPYGPFSFVPLPKMGQARARGQGQGSWLRASLQREPRADPS